MEGYSNAGALNTNNHAPVGGRRRGTKKQPKLRLVKKKTVRRMLKKMGMRMRGGADLKEAMASPPVPSPPTTTTGGSATALTPGQTAGRRRRHKKKGLMGLF